MSEIINDAFWWVVATLVAAWGWLLRHVLTDHKKVAVLEANAISTKELLTELRNDVKKMREEGLSK